VESLSQRCQIQIIKDMKTLRFFVNMSHGTFCALVHHGSQFLEVKFRDCEFSRFTPNECVKELPLSIAQI